MISWYKIAYLDRWIDDNQTAKYLHQPLALDWSRIAKLSEEVGEVTDAFIGATGQNPRKGTYKTMDDVLNELADVALTALCAIQHFTGDIDATAATVSDRVNYVYLRAGGEE